MLKKILILLAASVMLAGCSTNNGTETISFASWGSATEVKILKDLISEFEKENPEIKINFMHIPQNYFQKIHLLFASNTPPDIIFINNLYLPVYRKFLLPLNNFVNTNDYYPEALDALTIDNNLLAVPRDISNLLFYVNLDKTSLPDSSWTLDDLIRAGIKLKKENMYGVSYEYKTFMIQPYLSYFGGGILNDNNELIIDSNESQKGIKFYKQLKDEYKIAPSDSDSGSFTQAQMFLNGKTGFYLSGRWMYPKISETANFNWGVINFPYGKSPQPLDASGWAITASSKHKDSAKKFVEYLSGEKCSYKFTGTGLIVPARKETSKMLNTNRHNEKIFLEIIKHSKRTPVNDSYGKITDEINKSLDL